MSIEHRNPELPTWEARPESPEDDEARASKLLVNLEIDWETLRGKRVLDLGAGTGFFKRVAEHHGVDVVSIDLGVPTTEGKLYAGLENFLIADLDKDHLPLRDESFDFVLIRGFPAANAQKPHRVEEILRVLRQGGQCRQDIAVSPEACVIAEMEKISGAPMRDPEEQQRVLGKYLQYHKEGKLPHPWKLARTAEEQVALLERSQQELQEFVGERASVEVRRSTVQSDEDAPYWVSKKGQILIMTKR